MAQVPAGPAAKACINDCGVASTAESLNRSCYCLTLDESALRRELEADLGHHGMSREMIESHPHLFASLPMFVLRDHVERMAAVVRAVEAVAATGHFRQAALAWAPEIARYDPGSAGGLLGFDFHLVDAGPQLIEINTNPGGALLNTLLGRAHRACCADTAGLAMAPMEAGDIEAALFEVFLSEWRAQRGDAPLKSVVLVDDSPAQQYLYPEFLLYRQFFGRHGIAMSICDPRELERKDGRLRQSGHAVDFVYNRLTDFALQQPAQSALRLAYCAGEVVVSPHPRAHALYADKRNLSLLCNEAFLRETGVDEVAIATLVAAIPRTELMSAANRDALWSRRRQLFFKPAAGYGSKAAYRGDKLTKRVWEDVAKGPYVAQALVAPSERHIANGQNPAVLKADIRAYAYGGAVKLFAARLYQGQTTNFRTPGGGFAPVFTRSQ